MVRVGVHVSIAGSLDLAVDRAKEPGATCFRCSRATPVAGDINRFWIVIVIRTEGKVQATGIIPVDHMPYLPDLASPNRTFMKNRSQP